MSPLPVDRRWFRLRVDSGAAPYGQYFQRGDLVWAEFHAGGELRIGRLVGIRRPDGAFDAAYCLAMADGELVAGTCLSVPELQPDGRLTIADHWHRQDGTRGVSYIDEIPFRELREA